MGKPETTQSSLPAPGSTDLSVTFEIGVREHVSAQRALMLRHPAGWVLYGLLVAVPLGMIIYEAFLDRHPHPEKWVLVGAAVVVSAVSSYAFAWGPVLSLRKGQPGIDGPQTMTLNDDGVRIQFVYSNINLTWDAIYSARETNKFILIHPGKNVCYVLPKRVLDAELLSLARGVLRSHLGNRAKVWRSHRGE
jgi:hypothetical protein